MKEGVRPLHWQRLSVRKILRTHSVLLEGHMRARGQESILPLWAGAEIAMGANSSRRSVVGLESREPSIRESSPVRESESRLTASQVSDGIKWHTQYHEIRV